MVECICWDCKRARGGYCPRFGNTIRNMPYMKIENGSVVQCDMFVKEEKVNTKPKEIAKYFKKSMRTFYKHRKEYLRMYFLANGSFYYNHKYIDSVNCVH